MKSLTGDISELFIQNLPKFELSSWLTVIATKTGQTESSWCELFLYQGKVADPQVGTQVVITRKKVDSNENMTSNMYRLGYLTTDYLDSFVWDTGNISYDKNSPRGITYSNFSSYTGTEFTGDLRWEVETSEADGAGNLRGAAFPFYGHSNSKDTSGGANRWIEEISSWNSRWVDTQYWGNNNQLYAMDGATELALWSPNGGKLLDTASGVLWTTQSANNHSKELTALAVNDSKFGTSTTFTFPVFRHEVDCGNHVPFNWAYAGRDLKRFQKWTEYKDIYPKLNIKFNLSYWRSAYSIIMNSKVTPKYRTTSGDSYYAIPTKGWPFVANFSSSENFYNNLVVKSDQIDTSVTFSSTQGKKIDDTWYFKYYTGTPFMYANASGPCEVTLEADQNLDLWISEGGFSDTLPQNDSTCVQKSEITVDNSVTTTLTNAVHLNAGDNKLKFDMQKGKIYFIKWAKTGSGGVGGGTVTIPRTYDVTTEE